jgi:kumamolisin
MNKVPLPGSERQEPPGSRIGTPSPNQRFSISVVLRPRSSEGERFAKRPPNQRLIREQLATVHGADPRDVAKIEAFAAENNLSVQSVHLPTRTVDLSGTATDLSKAFQVDLGVYEFQGRTFRGYGGPTFVPEELVPIIQEILGLDNRPIARRHFVSPIVINALPSVTTAYNFPTGVNGTGQTIGVIALEGGFDPNDLSSFWSGLGIANFPGVVEVSVDNTHNNPGQNIVADKEVTFDVSICGGVAPGGKIVVYFTPNTTSGITHALQTAVGDINNAPSVISLSFGSGESNFSPNERLIIDQTFQDAAALSQPITIFCSSGDFGSSDGQSSGQQVEFPGSSPNLTTCGGSVLTISPAGGIASEIVWNEAPTTAATGGGVSEAFPLPTYQTNANVPPSSNGFVGRGLPDVASHAAGISVQFNGAVDKFAGTSAASPLWAGLVALINQLKGQNTGFLNEILYGRLGPQGALNDITVGDNGFFQAGPGWDACTGLGSPNGSLIAALIGPPTITSVSPTAGPVGGGIPITIRGKRLFGASLVSFGGTDTHDFHVDDDTQITVRLPQNSSDGTVTVTVTTAAGSGGGSPNSDFSYVFPVPVIQSINPPTGGVGGGEPININGLGFTGATSVLFNNVTMAPTSVTDTQIGVITPTGFGSGAVDVTVITPGGQSSPSTFIFVFPTPVVQSVSPTTGPAAGGFSVAIAGKGFTGVIAVRFGATVSPNVVPDPTNPDSQLTAVSPPGSGIVDISVTTPGGTSAATVADQLTYMPVPVVTAINPNSGPAGGTTVTITGTGFTGVTGVAFGANISPNVVPDPTNPDTQLTAVSPPGNGMVDIAVTTPAGTSVATGVDQFTYLPVPVVTTINPNSGPVAGSTTVTVIGSGFSGVTGVAFGVTGSTNVVPDSSNPDTQLTADSPAGTGTVDVIVTTPGGSSVPTAVDQFTYQ